MTAIIGNFGLSAAAALSFLVFSAQAQSESTDSAGGGSPFSFGMYGTLGLAHSNDHNADYISNLWRPDGVGHTHEWSADLESRLGVQVSADLTSKFTAVVQVIFEQGHDGSYRPELEWANIRFQPTPDFSMRIGRIVQPTFLYADSRKVGYTYPWVRPPTELYYLVPVTNNDGVDLTYRMHFGEVVNTIAMFYGGLDSDMPDRFGGGEAKSRDTAAVMNALEYGPLMLRVSYHQTRLTVPGLNPLFEAFRQFGPEGVAIAERFNLDDSKISFYALGVNYDPGNWFVTGEAAQSRSRSFIGDSRGWYLSGGMRLGEFTPYISYARLTVTSDTSVPGLTVSSLPPPLRQPAAALNGTLNGILSGVAAQKTVGVGVRWDFRPNFALKLQYEYIDREEQSSGTFINEQPGFDPGGTAGLFSASIDFVF